MKNEEVVEKYFIIKDLAFSDFMKEDDDKTVQLYDTLERAVSTCGIYEFPNVLVCKVVCNYVDRD